jgi:acetylornithine/succinyldiaminopimelate/putrescine aminotransferase
MSAATFQARMAEHGVLCFATGPDRVRLVTHHGITTDDARAAVLAAERALGVAALC